MVNANATNGIPDHDQLLRAHRGRHQLTVQVDPVFDVSGGWSSLSAVKHYLHLSTDALSACVEALEAS